MVQKIIYWLLVSLILSIGFGQLLRFDFYGLPLFIHDILVGVLLTLSAVELAKNYKVRNFVIPLWLKLLLTGLVIGYLRAMYLYPIISLLAPSLYGIRILMYLALYLFLKTKKIQIPKTVYILSGVIALVIGLFQYMTIPDMRIFQYLGWDDHLNRLTLPHFDPTFSGVMLGLFALWLINIKFSYKAILLALSSLAIMLTYSRSVWVSLMLTAVMMIKNKGYLLLIIATIFIAAIALPKRFGEGNNLFRTYSISSRIQSDFSYIKKYKWEFGFGRGMNTLVLDQSATARENHATGPNNSYLYLLLTTGVIGFAGWSLFMYTLFKSSSYKPMLAFLFVASLFNNVMFYSFALLWILLIETMVPSEA